MSHDPFQEKSGAIFSPDRVYRYALFRRLKKAAGPTVNFICLKPGTADEILDSQLVRRCIQYAKRWGAARLVMTNLFAFRAICSKDLRNASVPIVGPDNTQTTIEWARRSDIVIAAWGNEADLFGRWRLVLDLLVEVTDLHFLGLTPKGYPRHPFDPDKIREPKLWKRKQ